MKSRYDYMIESDIADIDSEKYYDPQSATYNDVQLTKVVSSKQVGDKDLTKFWLFMKDNYGIEEMDDILLNINGIPFLGTLVPGDSIYMVDYNDLENAQTQKFSDSDVG